MPMPDGNTWNYTPGDMGDLGQLGYTYDDLSPAVAAPEPGQRLLRLGASAAATNAIEGAAVPSGNNVELVGANRESLRITGDEARTSVRLDTGMLHKVSASLARATAAEEATPDRVFLNLENVRGLVDSTAFQVYIGLPDEATPDDHPERLAGSTRCSACARPVSPRENMPGKA
jgi:tyrosinase